MKYFKLTIIFLISLYTASAFASGSCEEGASSRRISSPARACSWVRNQGQDLCAGAAYRDSRRFYSGAIQRECSKIRSQRQGSCAAGTIRGQANRRHSARTFLSAVVRNCLRQHPYSQRRRSGHSRRNRTPDNSLYCKQHSTGRSYYGPAYQRNGRFIQDYLTSLERCQQQLNCQSGDLMCVRIRSTNYYAPYSISRQRWMQNRGTAFETCVRQITGGTQCLNPTEQNEDEEDQEN